MKNWKKLLACLLAGMMVLSMLTACTVQQNGVMSASADSTKELCAELNVKYSEDLSSKAYAIASWMVSNTVSIYVDAAGFHRVNVTNDDFMSALMRKDYLDAFSRLDANVAADDSRTTVGVRIQLMSKEKTNDQVDFTVPVNGSVPSYVKTAAAGKTEMGAAYIKWDGVTYTVTVFR